MMLVFKCAWKRPHIHPEGSRVGLLRGRNGGALQHKARRDQRRDLLTESFE